MNGHSHRTRSHAPWVSQDKQTRLLEALLNLIGEGTGCMAPGQSLAAGVLAELEHGALSIRTSRQDTHILRILNAYDDASSHDELVPGLAQVDNVDTSVLAPADVALHLEIAVLCAQMALGCQHHGDVHLLVCCDRTHSDYCLQPERTANCNPETEKRERLDAVTLVSAHAAGFSGLGTHSGAMGSNAAAARSP